MDRGRKHKDTREAPAILVQDETDKTPGFARATAPDQGAANGHFGKVLKHTLALGVLRRREELNLSHINGFT